MRKNISGQKVGCQMTTIADGSEFTGAVTVYVTGDAGVQAVGTVGAGACTHEGHGYHTYAPSQAEINYDLAAFTFVGTGAITATVQVETSVGAVSGDVEGNVNGSAASVSGDIGGNILGNIIGSLGGNVSGSIIGSIGGNLTALRIRKNTAYSNFVFYMEKTDGTVGSGLTVTAQRSLDGGTFASCANAVTEISAGWYKISFALTDLNANNVAFKAAATGAKQRNILIVTQS